MTNSSLLNWEIALVLPLGVVANQLARVEADLRLLNVKAANLGDGDGDGTREDIRLLDSKLERIHDTVDAIKTLLAQFSAELHSKSIEPNRAQNHKSKRQFERDD